MTSSIYALPLTLSVPPISAANDIVTDISITSAMVKPGGGGTLRLLFSFEFAASPATISVFNNAVFKGNLNADDSAQVVTDGYYRFDIDVEAGDEVNLQSSQQIDTINVMRAHLVQFGA